MTNKTSSCILKANLSWTPTYAKFCQLFSSLSVVNLTKFDKTQTRVHKVWLEVQKRKI